MNKAILTAYRYHRANGGTAAGSLHCARIGLLLAEAEGLGVAEVKWEHEQERYEDVFGFESDEEREHFHRDLESGTITGPYFVALDVNGEHGASVGMVTLGPGDIERDYYARLTVIELASECEDELRQAIGDARDAKQESPLI